MPRAPRFWGPRARLLSSIFSEFFCSMFQCEIQTVRQCGALKSPSPPENARAPKFKKRVSIKLGPFVPCFSVGAQRAQGPQKTSGPKSLKIEVPNSRVFCFLFQRRTKQRRAPKSPRPLKAKPPNKNTRGPKV